MFFSLLRKLLFYHIPFEKQHFAFWNGYKNLTLKKFNYKLLRIFFHVFESASIKINHAGTSPSWIFPSSSLERLCFSRNSIPYSFNFATSLNIFSIVGSGNLWFLLSAPRFKNFGLIISIHEASISTSKSITGSMVMNLSTNLIELWHISVNLSIGCGATDIDLSIFLLVSIVVPKINLDCG